MKSKLVLAALFVPVMMMGCALVAVTEDALIERTAFALGLEKGSFTIANRVDDGVTTRYSVTAKNQ